MQHMPRMFISFHWDDRASGRVRYKLHKAWVARPGAQTSSREILEGTATVETHYSEESALFAAVLRAMADELAQDSHGQGGPTA